MDTAEQRLKLKELVMDDKSSRAQIQSAAELVTNPNFYEEYEKNKVSKRTSYSLLMYASECERYDALEILLEVHPNIDITWENNRGSTVLQLCAKRGQLDMAKMLYNKVPSDKRLDFINKKNNKGWTPLHAACENENYRFPQWLLLNGAEPSPQMHNTNWTPMHCAAKKGNIQIMKLLMSKGADPHVKAGHRDFGNVTPIEVLNRHVDHSSETNKLPRDACIESKGMKQLKALVVILMVHHENHPRLHYGAQEAYPDIKAKFEENVECEIFPMPANGKFTKNNLPVAIRQIKRKMQSGQFGLLFWLISSHGGTDQDGSFFLDSHLNKVHVFPDIINQFSVDKSATMEGKYAFYFLDYCRQYSRGSTSDETEQILAVPTSDGEPANSLLCSNITDHGNYAIVYTSSEGEPALHEGSGPRASLQFAQVLQEHRLDDMSIRQLINIASKNLRGDMFRIGDAQGSEGFYTQSMAVLDHICEDIGFMPKKSS